MGVLNNENFCFIIARVFGSDVEGAARQSDILEAVTWVAGMNAVSKSWKGAFADNITITAY